MPDVDEGSAVAHNEIHGVLRAGTTLPGYELKSILGKGDFGVTSARDVTVNHDVAKECLPTSLFFCKRRTTQRVMPNSLLEAASASSMRQAPSCETTTFFEAKENTRERGA